MADKSTNLRSFQRNPSNDEFDFLDDPIEFDDDDSDFIAQSRVKTTPVTAPIATPPVIIKRPGGGNTIIVSGRQRGNPILGHIRNVAWEYGEIVPDYVVGQTSCVLFLSLRYHRLHPEYIYSRVQALGHTYQLRILLLLVDIESHQEPIRELTKLSVTSDLTLILAWSPEEAGRYLETYKALEHKPPDLIMEKVENDYHSRLNDYLTSVRSVNQTDVLTLASNFGSLKNIMDASVEQLAMCPGFGEQKIKYLADAFHKPFVVKKKK